MAAIELLSRQGAFLVHKISPPRLLQEFVIHISAMTKLLLNEMY